MQRDERRDKVRDLLFVDDLAGRRLLRTDAGPAAYPFCSVVAIDSAR